jgi:peptidoglycan hydrolase CwlO-like protein
MKKVLVFSLIVLVLCGQLTPALAFNVDTNRQKLQLELDQLNKDIAQTQAEIDKITVDLELLTKQIIVAYQKLDLAKKELKKQEAGFNKRLQEVYKNYYDFLVFFVLDSPNFNSLWDRFSFLAKVNAADREMLAQRRRQVKEVRQLRKGLISKKKQQLNLKKAKLVHLLELQKLKLQKQALLASLPVAD